MSDLQLAIKLTTQGGNIVVKDLQQIKQATEQVNHDLQGTLPAGRAAQQGFNSASTGASGLTNSLKAMIAQTAGIIALGLGVDKIASGMYKSIDSFQGYRGQLKTITGDFNSASKELERLIQLSKETPFTLKQSVEGFAKLTNLGLEPSKKAMISYGNTASAMGKDLMQMIEAVADASTFEFERLKEFGITSKQQGDYVTFTFRGVATTIRKSAKNIQQYLIGLGNTHFAGAMDDQMGRLSAKASNLETAFAELYDEIGKAGAAKIFGDTTDEITKSLNELKNNAPEIINDLSILLEGMSVIVGSRLLLAFVSLAKVGLSQYYQANIKAAFATNSLGQAVGRTTLRMNLMTQASRAAKGALALLGGPAGVALIASYGLYELYQSMNKTQTGAEQLAEATGKATKAIEDMNRAEQVSTIAAYKKLIKEKEASIKKLEELARQQASRSIVASGKNSSLGYGVQSFATSEQINRERQALSALKKSIVEVQGAMFDADMAHIKWTKRIENGVEVSLKAAQKTITLSSETQNLIDKLDPASAKARTYGENVKALHQAYLQGALGAAQFQRYLSLLTQAYNQSTKAKKAELSADQQVVATLAEELAVLRMSAKEKALFNNLRKLSADATEAERAQVVALTEALVEQQQWQSDSDYYDQLITGANDVGEAWSLAGNVIIDTFGSIGQQLNKLASQQAKYAEQQKKIAQDKIKYQDDPKKLAKIGKAEEQLAYTRTSANLSSYAAISGAASKMFAENSKGRKALHAMETVFTVAEVALAMQRAAANAIAAIANQGNGDPYTAFARIAAMTALMAGLGIAVSGGGSGTPPVSAEQRQQNQGTGTVLGSEDKSQSIINAFERIEDLELDQYGELRQMNTSLRDLNNNISRLAVSLIGGYGKFNEQSYTGQLGTSGQLDVSNWLLGSVGFIDQLTGGLLGGIISGFKKTKKTLIDSGISIVSQTFGSILESGLVNARAYYDIKTKKSSWWGLSSSTKYSTEYQGIDSQIQREFALIFTNIGDSINQAVSLLGLDVTRSLDNFIINLGEISFKDMSGDDIQKELEAIFSQQADLMAQYLVPGIGEFQQAGEGLYETLLRVAQEQVVFNQVLELTSQSLSGIDPYQQIQVAQSIIEFAGSIEALQSAANTYLNEFFTDAEQFAFNQQQLNEQFAALNTSLPSTREGFKTLLSSLDLTNEADQRLYAALMLLVPQLDSYYDALEQQGKQAEDAAKKERELALARGEFVESFAEQLARLDMTPLETKLADLTQQFDDYRKQAEELGADTSLLEQLYARKRQAIIDDALAEVNNTYQRELDKLTSTHQRAVDDLVSNNERLAASISTISNNIGNNILALKRSMAGWDEIGYQRGNISNLRGQLGVGSIEQQLGTIDALNTALWDKYQAELDHNRSMSELAQQRYQDDLANYENLTEAAKNLKQAADDLRFGELSIYSTTEQFGFAKSSFEQALASGDLTKLQDAGKQYLEQAKTYYGGTASSEYQAIFERVTNAFGHASAGSAPSIPAEIQQYQQADLALQTELLTELESLQAMTDALNAERTEQFNNDFASLTEAYNDGIAALDTTLAEQTSALTDGFNAVVEAVNALPPIKPTVVTPPPDLPPFEIIPMPVEPPIGSVGGKNDDMAYITPVKPTPGETALAGSRQLDELVALTRAQNARLEALEMRQAEQNSRNNTRRYIA